MDELFEDEFELEFEELFDDEFELEFDELLEDEFELELLDEFELELDELLPATMIVPLVWAEAWLVCLDEPPLSSSIGCTFASAAEPTIAAKPAASAVFIQILVMPITPHLNWTCPSVRWSNGRPAPLFQRRNWSSPPLHAAAKITQGFSLFGRFERRPGVDRRQIRVQRFCG